MDKNKVFVAVSGGVDSSVCAALLKEKGYDVVGVFIKVWQPDFLECDWRKEREDAMRVCAHLGIPFQTFDLEKEYKKDVVDYMISEYEKGRTPNPDVMCNKNIKFGAFLKKAKEQGADLIATGHHARLRGGAQDGAVELLAGVDKNKDQTYFLWTLTQEQLGQTFFPVGEFEKGEVREIAKKFGLSTAEKKDSQGVCFLGEVEMRKFLSRYIPEEKGGVLNEKGKVIGWHNGASYFTLGQRHGFYVTTKTDHDKPRYVIKKDISKNTITVSDEPGKEGPLYNAKEVEIDKVNWISGLPPDESKKYGARIRYRQPLEPCRVALETSHGRAKVIFDEPQKAAAAGQSLVIYDGEKCLGGGIIENVILKS